MKTRSLLTETPNLTPDQSVLRKETEQELRKLAQDVKPGDELRAKEQMVAVGLSAVVALRLKEKTPSKEAFQYYMGLYEKERAEVSSNDVNHIIDSYLNSGMSAKAFFQQEQSKRKVDPEVLKVLNKFANEAPEDSNWLTAVYALRRQESTPRTVVANSIKALLGNRLKQKPNQQQNQGTPLDSDLQDNTITVRTSAGGKYTSKNGKWYNETGKEVTSAKGIRYLDDLADEKVSKRQKQKRKQ